MSFFHNEVLNTLLILSFILKVNSYSIFFESLACYSAYPYTGVIQNILLLSFATLFLTDWITLKDYIKIGFLYKALPWMMGLVYMGTYELWNRKSVGGLCIDLGLLIAIGCCFLVLFRLLKLAFGLLWQKSVQHPRHRQVEIGVRVIVEERSFIREGGIMPWRGVKLVIVCIVNGAVMMGSQEPVLNSNCILSVAVAMVMLTIGIIDFGLFSCQYVLRGRAWGSVATPARATGAGLDFRKPTVQSFDYMLRCLYKLETVGKGKRTKDIN